MTVTALIVLVPILVLAWLAALDGRADRREWRRLVGQQPADPAPFDPAVLQGLPEPAQRYFRFAIRPGTPLHPVVEIDMRGQFALGIKDKPGYRPMRASQILAAPEGFVWRMRTGGVMRLSGSDSGRWTRFRLWGLIPVARAGGDADHARSAYGRCVGEALIWAPASLLPGPGITWEPLGADSARVTLEHRGLRQSVDLQVDAEGRPCVVSFQRWSNANPEQRYRWQPFGAELSDFREVAGYRLPHRASAGNHFGTPDYFPFFVVEVARFHFPAA
jgi:hypothetical protein